MARKPKAKGKPLPFFVDGAGKKTDFQYGVLRREYAGRTNTVTGFFSGKLLIGADGASRAWRSDVVTPSGSPDRLSQAHELWRDYEAQLVPGQRDLALVLTVWTPHAPTLGDAWEAARGWVRTAFCEQRSLPVTLVQHHPGIAGSPTDPHLHVVVAARQLSRLGWGSFTDLCRDEKLLALHADWLVAAKAAGVVPA